MKICPFCAEEIQDDAIVCRYCGRVLEKAKVDQVETSLMSAKSATPPTARSEPSNRKPVAHCTHCGVAGPTKKVQFYQNIGLLYRRLYRQAEGDFCRACIEETFWPFTGKTLFLGWFGIISAFIAPIIIVANAAVYIGCLRLPFAEGRPRALVGRGWKGAVRLTIGALVVSIGFSVTESVNLGALSVGSPGSTTTQTSIQVQATSRPTARPTVRPRPTSTSIPAQQEPACMRWQRLTDLYAGREVCVYGTIAKHYSNEQYAHVVRFSEEPGTFLLISTYMFYKDIRTGMCVAAIGTVQSSGTYLYMDIATTELYEHADC